MSQPRPFDLVDYLRSLPVGKHTLIVEKQNDPFGHISPKPEGGCTFGGKNGVITIFPAKEGG